MSPWARPRPTLYPSSSTHTDTSLLGTFNFLGLYFGGGIFAGLCSLAYQHLNRKPGRVSGSEGASGAIYSCLAFYGTIFPQATFLLFFVVPMRAWMVVGGLFAVSGMSGVRVFG